MIKEANESDDAEETKRDIDKSPQPDDERTSELKLNGDENDNLNDEDSDLSDAPASGK